MESKVGFLRNLPAMQCLYNSTRILTARIDK